MTHSIEIRKISTLPGRALYVGKDDDWYIARRYDIYRSDDAGLTWHLDCRLPSRGWKPWAAGSRLAARLLRYYVAAFRVLDDGSRIAVGREGLFRAEAGETRMTPVFRLSRGSRPLNIAVDGRRVIFGEYGDGFESEEVRIYVSEDGGRSFQIGYSFPRGDIRHVHNVLADPYADHYWVFVGDFDRQPGIGVLSKDMKTLEWISRGSQRCRAVGAVVEADGLVYGSDSDRERNYILRLDRRSGKIEELREVEGSSLYAARFGPVRIISTCVEPNPACPRQQCSLYASLDRYDWHCIVTHKKDRHNPVFFQFGTLVLPYANNESPLGMYSGQAIKEMDDRVSIVDFTISEKPSRTNAVRRSASIPVVHQ